MPVITIGVKWGKQSYTVDVDTSQDGFALKTQLFSLTGVPPDRIKLMGLKGGKSIVDDTDLSTVGLDDLAAKNKKLMMMGSTAPVITAPTTEITFVEDLPEDEQHAASMRNFSPGLTNLGNTCYMNSCLQCLYAIPELRTALAEMDESPGDDGNTGGRALALATRDLFNEIKTATAAVTPFRFLALLRQLFPQFAQMSQGGVYAQQDAEECWGQIVTTLARTVPAIQRLFALKLAMSLKSEETGETREETLTQLSLKCNITLQVNHLSDGFKVGLTEERELRSEITSANTLFTGESKLAGLPPVLNAHLVRMFYKLASNLDAEGSAGNKAKILRSVAFPERLDLYEHCAESLKKELDPARKDKLEAEEIEASAKLKLAQGKLEGNGKGAAGTKEEADKLLDAMKAGSGEEATAEKKRRVGEGSSSAVDAEMVDADAAAVPETAEAIEAAATAAAAEAAEAARAKASSEKCDGTRPTGVYSLVAVLTHKGRSSDSGHYESWVKNAAADDSWTEFDDHTPTPKTATEILNLKGGGDHHMGYILVYKAQHI